jgi:antitoxin (DNA-binding transcriptional repressor) of toxin-antitoxin stability system
METTITAAQLADNLSDVLDRVKDRGERFVIQRNGEVVAIIEPPSPKLGITARELIAQVGNLRFPGEGFGDDLEAVQAAQPPVEMTEWPD